MLKIIVFALFNLILLNTFACPISKSDKLIGEQCVEVDGVEFYMNIFGQDSPTVVFINGLGDDVNVWNKVTPGISKFARVVTYDRSGIGKSQPCLKCKSFSALDNMKILKSLLQRAKVKPPYIMVGHSIGGLYAQLFAQMYPKDIIGVVLVDSSSRNQIISGNNPPKIVNYYKEAVSFNDSRTQVKHIGYFPKVPLIILTATKHPGHENQEVLWQRELLKLSPQSTQMIAYGSGHYIAKDQPILVVDAVATVINQFKNK